ncbi:PREDICTED: protein SREK1IP1-like [Branchiostoma belcheri]|uniref:Protein SREK1IP1-like n=1 Tax=Branchiostoma belcheri TaxID=7741 RepID=A0A6P5A9M2_BRABE|nr:PREDICTED: protein SREK1IP1-like [Branchiostoma belcheri]
MTPRSSDRLRTRANRQFRLPSRDEVLSRIVPKDSKETPSKSLAELRPRKLVNNFLKVNNRYNYDPDFTDSDTSLGGFLDDEEEKEEEGNSTSDGEDNEDGSRSQTSQSSSSEEEECLKRSKRPRGRQKLREIRKEKLLDRETDSDDEDEMCTTTKKRRRRQSSVLDDSSSNEDQPEEGRKQSRRAESLKRKKRKQNFFEEYRAKRALRKAKV